MHIQKKIPSNPYQSFDNKILVEKCLANDRKAWDEFFRRFTPAISKNIHKILDTAHRRKIIFIEKPLKGLMYRKDEDTEEIYDDIVIKLYTGALAKCKNFSDVQPWLIILTRNHVFDWLAHKNSAKARIEEDGIISSSSIDEFVGNGKARLSDVLRISADDSENETSEEICSARQHILHEVIKKINALKNDKSYWILRLSALSEWNLDEEETLALCKSTGCTSIEIKAKIDSTMINIYKKIAQREKHFERAADISSELIKIEKNLYKSENFHSEDEIKALRKLYAEKIATRDRHIKASHAECRPSDKEIAAIMNLSEKEAKQVSVILHRVRKHLSGKSNANAVHAVRSKSETIEGRDEM